MYERSSLRNRWLWLPLPSPQHYAAACRTTLHIRRIRRMAGFLVPHSLAGDRQCVFLSGTGCPIGTIGCRFDIGSLGTALGLGKDKGMEIFFRSMGMSSLCIVCLEPMVVSFLTNCIHWIRRFHCQPTRRLNALLEKCVFVLIIRIWSMYR